LTAEGAYQIDGYINYWYSKACKNHKASGNHDDFVNFCPKPFLFIYKIKMKEANCDKLLQQGYAHIPKELYGTCGIMFEDDDGESFSDISCASTEKNSTSTAPAAKKCRRDETGSSMIQFMKERAEKSNARDETFLEGMNVFKEKEKVKLENEKMKLEENLLLRIEIFSLEIGKKNAN